MTPKENWALAFEKHMGRKPNPDEFLEASRRNFDLATINDSAHLEAEQRPLGYVWQPQLTPLTSPQFHEPDFADKGLPWSWISWLALGLGLLLPFSFLLLPWPWTWGSLAFSFVLFLLYLVGCLKVGGKTWLAWLTLALVSLSLVLNSGILLYQGLEVANVFPDSREPSHYAQEDATFNWTTKSFKQYRFEGSHPTPLRQVIRERGLASQSQMVAGDLQLVYVNLADTSQTVTLVFSEDKGHFYLKAGQADNLDKSVRTQATYQSDWTRESFEALKVGIGDGRGSSWSRIQAQHGLPSSAKVRLTSTTDGQFDQVLTVTYRDNDTPENRLSSVYLTFIWKQGQYTLQSKSSLD
ncbi:hypothetical protein [Streptococcus sp. DD12]|uniref:hypothetical protein n=1 Tax=Streptococcus sp. DD12 TaxID=1777880 RepID=UPI00079BD24E|nr:hypothetical protein [Streptococcus sp. DD12]KXT75881.1 hypothetical protein STRDD12_00993 [Streptococcus sp. DD12]